MTLQMSQLGCGIGHMNDWMELSGLRGLGQSEAEEVAKIQAEKAAIQAEIARLKGGGAPTPGGFQVARATQRQMAPPPPPRPAWPRVVGGLAVLGLGAYLVSRIAKRRR